MIITATIILSGLSQEVRMQSFIESYYNEDPQYQSYVVEEDDVVNNVFYYSDLEQSKRRDLINEIIKEDLNQNVINSTIEVIKSLPSLFIMNFDFNELYKSTYGTIVFEFIKDESNFTIEIGENSFGYFSEKSNKIKHLQEELTLSKDQNNDIVLGQLNLDFVDFYNEI